MRLSEAIRLGALLRPQAFGMLTDGIGSCALGAAGEAIGRDWRDKWEKHPAVDAICPACGLRPWQTSPKGGSMFMLTPAHLNDDHLWSRELIADWTEQIEAQHSLEMQAINAAIKKAEAVR